MMYKAIFSTVAAAVAYFAFMPAKDAAFDVLAHDIKDMPQEEKAILAEGREYGAKALTALFALVGIGAAGAAGASLDRRLQNGVDAEKAERSSSVVTFAPTTDLPANLDTPPSLRHG
jgi:hypothetical protein